MNDPSALRESVTVAGYPEGMEADQITPAGSADTAFGYESAANESATAIEEQEMPTLDALELELAEIEAAIERIDGGTTPS